MSVPVLRLVSSAAILGAAALPAGSAAAGDPQALPEEHVEIAEPASGAVDIVDTSAAAAGEHGDRRPARSRTAGPAEAGPTGEGMEGVTAASVSDAEAQPASRLLRSLGAWPAQPAAASPPLSPDGVTADVGRSAAEAAIGGSPGSSPGPARSAVLHGCPRALLASLLAEATETADAVSALAIERETLELCRERQEIVNGIVALEDELGALLAISHVADDLSAMAWADSATMESLFAAMETLMAATETPIVKESRPVRVVSLPPGAGPAGEAPEKAPALAVPESAAYFWFSIIGTAGDLRAGVGDGERVWFVREGDRLPGDILVTGIGTRPPGVHVGGAGEAALPYRPGPAAGSAAGDGR